MSEFNISVPQDELPYDLPTRDPVPTGKYPATFEGAEYQSGENENGTWEAANTRFQITDRGGNTKQVRRLVFGRIPVSNATLIARYANALSVAKQNEDGTVGVLADSFEEFVQQLDAMKGTEVTIKVQTGPRRQPVRNEAGEITLDENGRQVWETVNKDDGTPWVDTKVRSVEPI